MSVHLTTQGHTKIKEHITYMMHIVETMMFPIFANAIAH